jgi:hypothetical protein
MSTAIVVLVRDVKTSRVHKRFRDDGDRALYARGAEADDTSGAFEVMTSAEVEAAAREDFCTRCFDHVAWPA